MQRGEVHSRNRARQIRDYSGLRYGNITPTDIDGLIEYHGKAYILIELKYQNATLSYGQKLALERLTDDLSKPAICIIGSHDTHNPDNDIDAANAIAVEYRYHKEWHIPKREYTVKGMIDRFLQLVNGDL